MNKIERIDIYNKIEPYLSKELKRKVIEEIGINEYDIVERGSGKLKEIELEIIMLYSNKCKLIIPLEENIPNVMGGKIPDYLVVLESGEVILIEVKSTKEHKKKFTSENYINKQEEYASLLGGSLYYAINLNGFWMLFHSDYLKNKVGKITIKDVKNSKLCKVFGIKGFLVEKGFCIEQIYDKRGISDLEAYHKNLLNKLNQVFEGLISDNLPVREYKESELLIEVKE